MKTAFICRLFLMCLLLSFSKSLSAQCSLSGKVVDQSKRSVEAANVQLLRADSTFFAGTVCNKDGCFVLNHLERGNYILVISHVEYEKMYRNVELLNQDNRLDTISLMHENKVLAGVEIVADRIIKKKDGMLIYPRKQALKFAGSGYDVLYNIMIPGVSVDRNKGEVTRLGAVVSIYIDGQKAEYREIQNIETATIDRIEFIDVPSGRYIQDNSAINIVTKKKVDGSYFALDGKQYVGYLNGDYNVTAQFSKGNNSFHLFTGGSTEKYDNSGSKITEEYYLNGKTVSRYNQVLEDLHKNHNAYFQFNFKSVTRKRSLSLKTSLVYNGSPENRTLKNIRYLNLDADDLNSAAKTEDKNYKPSLELYGNFKLPNKQTLSITLGSSYDRNKYNREYFEDNFRTFSYVKEDFYNAKANIDYSKKIKKNNIFSASLLENYRLSNSNYAGSSNYQQHLYTNEAILQLGYMHNFSRNLLLNIQLGGSWLNYCLRGEETFNQLTPRANFMLRYTPFQKQAFTFQFNSGNSFPMVSSLNAVDQAINSILIQRGNPDLDMSKLYNVALFYNLFSKKVNLQIMFINNIYTNLTVPYYYTENDKVVSTFNSNVDLNQQIGVLSGTWNIIDKLDLKTEFAILHTKFTGAVNERHTTFRAMGDLNYSWKNVMLNVYVRAKEKMLSNSAIFNEDYISYGGSLRWSTKKWHIEAGVSNPFSKNNHISRIYTSSAYSYVNETFSQTYQGVGYFKLIYRFNYGKKQKVEKRKVDRVSNSAIMKIN